MEIKLKSRCTFCTQRIVKRHGICLMTNGYPMTTSIYLFSSYNYCFSFLLVYNFLYKDGIWHTKQRRNETFPY